MQPPLPRHFLSTLLLAVLLLSGCSVTKPKQDPTRFYVLRSPENEAQHATNTRQWKVNLRPVEVPSYLKVVTIAFRHGPNEISYADFHRWAEPLDQGIARVCKETLTRTATVESVTLNSRTPAEFDCDVTVRILACEGSKIGNGAATISFRAAWEVRTGAHQAVLRRGFFEAPATHWNGEDYGQLAETLSLAVNQLAQTLGNALTPEQ